MNLGEGLRYLEAQITAEQAEEIRADREAHLEPADAKTIEAENELVLELEL